MDSPMVGFPSIGRGVIQESTRPFACNFIYTIKEMWTNLLWHHTDLVARTLLNNQKVCFARKTTLVAVLQGIEPLQHLYCFHLLLE